jgi:hypothetical protein
MSADALIAKLDCVRRVGDRRWVASCPAHESQSKASLSVRELDDGRVLLHDFGGCAVDAVLGAIGLKLQDLFPEKIAGDFLKRERRPWDGRNALRSLVAEITVVALYASDLRAGRAPDHRDHERFLLACSTITQALRYCDGD